MLSRRALGRLEAVTAVHQKYTVLHRAGNSPSMFSLQQSGKVDTQISLLFIKADLSLSLSLNAWYIFSAQHKILLRNKLWRHNWKCIILNACWLVAMHISRYVTIKIPTVSKSSFFLLHTIFSIYLTKSWRHGEVCNNMFNRNLMATYSYMQYCSLVPYMTTVTSYIYSIYIYIYIYIYIHIY